VSRSAGPLLSTATVVAAVGLVAALALRRAELVVVAAPFAIAAGAGLRGTRPDVRAWFALDTERALEDDELPGVLTVRSDTGVERLEIGMVAPRGIEIVDAALPVAIRLAAGEERELPVTLRLTRWGAPAVGDVRLRSRDRLGLVRWEDRVERLHRLRVYPRPEQLRELVSPAHTQATTGSEVARLRGEGVEFADTRPFVTGDRLKSVNWRASARRASLIVNERHPERNADVVLFLDSFAEARESDEGTLEHAVRVVATVAARFLERRDRVGLVTFGGILRWLEPGGGLAQRYRLVDALLETGVELSYAWKDLNVIPARTLPPRALVIAVSPLLDERSVSALLDLRARGHDLVVIEVSPEPHVTPGTQPLEQLAHRIWTLQRRELRATFERLGVAVTTLADDTPLDVALEGVRSYRRHARVLQR
jgi:uncharacterized protein (DUF58 family)